MNGNIEQAIKMAFFFLFQRRVSFWLKEASSLVSQSIDLKLNLPMTRAVYCFTTKSFFLNRESICVYVSVCFICGYRCIHIHIHIDR